MLDWDKMKERGDALMKEADRIGFKPNRLMDGMAYYDPNLFESIMRDYKASKGIK